jgi:hypothetical protein
LIQGKVQQQKPEAVQFLFPLFKSKVIVVETTHLLLLLFLLLLFLSSFCKLLDVVNITLGVTYLSSSRNHCNHKSARLYNISFSTARGICGIRLQ